MADQTPMTNGAGNSRSPSAPLPTTYSAPSPHPLGFACSKCRSKHNRCDRTRPVCQNCQSMGFAAECSYPSVALPMYGYPRYQLGRVKIANFVSYSTENKCAENKITQKIGAAFSWPMFDSVSALPATGEKRPKVADSYSERTELVNAVVGLPIHNDLGHVEHHVEQMKTPEQPPAKRQKISELGSESFARQSALERSQAAPFGTGIPGGSRLDPPPRMRSISPTLREDEMELRCNLTTEINVQRMNHRNMTAAPLRNIIKLLNKAKSERPSAEGAISRLEGTQLNDEWREEDDLMEIALIKLEKGGRCSRALLSRFENFLYGPFMSPEERRTQERIICVEECLSSASAEPTANHNDLFLHRLRKVISHPDSYSLDKKDSRIGFLRNQLLAAISAKSKLSRANCKKFAELLDSDGIVNANLDRPGAKAETPTSTRKVPPKPASPRAPSSHRPETPSQPTYKQNTAIPAMPSASNKRPAPGSQLSNSNDNIASAAEHAASGALSLNSNNALAFTGDASSGSQPLNSDIPKQLWNIFLDKHGILLPALDLNQLKVAFNMAVDHGKLGPNVIDPTLGFCLALACHLTREKQLWEGRKRYDAAISTLKGEDNILSLEHFYRLILQIEYVHMVGDVGMSWRMVSRAIADAEDLQMHTMPGGRLAVDKKSLEQVRMIWQFLWMKKLYLTLQSGVVIQSLDVFYTPAMPMESRIQEKMGSYPERQALITSAFFVACTSLYKNTDDLITVESDLRVIRSNCPYKWLCTAEMCRFQTLQASLTCWKDGLPQCLEWKGAAIEFSFQKDPGLRRLPLLAHLRYIYFRLRQNRPFLVLAWRFSYACACEKNPHLTDWEMDSVDSSHLLGLVYYGATRCLAAAQDIVQTLSVSHKKEGGDHDKCEQLDYLYAAGLVLIAAMRIPCLMNKTQHYASPTAPVDRSMTQITKDFGQIDNILRYYQERCEQAPRLKQRFERCRDTLIRLQSMPSDQIISDQDITFSHNVWCRIYGRLDIDLPFERFPPGNPANDKVCGRKMTFGWLESLPFDLDSQGE
ncbi:hypothetical protein N7491_006705 [Penicillium cf. griseofulvum]|uniref:Zn(2)-C6 fungal-type domain-containing protein n=1 Tax=Penicillium cf. griseofulvum TaxID=2972120 RepID=A0A9W9IWX8_9EURO|nr:hypothetical protein N7472_010267 [Penicillium cf. griseofulvum]KAJ5429689.1 hypothetical protein N7491_006705 [Penicillium cf. griseofulvum]KAJ5436544.1 hypothetical protein N7445_007429 [Penicillium cf. griseofulvum]